VEKVWRDDQIPAPPAATSAWSTEERRCQPASLYQFRVVSYRRGDIPISATEDLRDVFLVP
jgi:hypothetical protein